MQRCDMDAVASIRVVVDDSHRRVRQGWGYAEVLRAWVITPS